jgi:hypothetical protein
MFLRDICPYRYASAIARKVRRSEAQKQQELKRVEYTRRLRGSELAGKKTFMDPDCTYGHGGERSIKDMQRVHCKSSRFWLRDAIKRGAYKEAPSKTEKVKIAAVYAEARELTKTSGIQYHVDHIKLLAAGGRHHSRNLQILTAEENLKKGASFEGVHYKYGSDLKQKYVKKNN